MIKKNKKQKKNNISCQLKNSSNDILFCLSNSTIEFMTRTIGRKWAFQIILELKKYGTLRYKALSQNLEGISPSTLSNFLKQLQKQSLISREVYGEIPPFQVDYSLTNRGKNLLDFLIPLLNFVSYLQQINCTECGCTTEGCKNSKSIQDCAYCENDQCCCWQYFHKK